MLELYDYVIIELNRLYQRPSDERIYVPVIYIYSYISEKSTYTSVCLFSKYTP